MKYFIELETWGTTTSIKDLDFFFDVYCTNKQQVKNIKHKLGGQEIFTDSIQIGLGIAQTSIHIKTYCK